jgi:hypothetical protein
MMRLPITTETIKEVMSAKEARKEINWNKPAPGKLI